MRHRNFLCIAVAKNKLVQLVLARACAKSAPTHVIANRKAAKQSPNGNRGLLRR
jgi:hypothetical protein